MVHGAVALRGLVKRAQAEAQKERTESAKKKADSLALRDRAQEILAQGKADDSLSDSELADLLKWKLGPRGGISKLGTKAKKLEKWREVKDGPDADDEEEEDAEPLPYEGELDFLLADAQTPRVSAPGDGGPATAVGTAATAQNFGVVEGMNLAELNALVALASAQKARLIEMRWVSWPQQPALCAWGAVWCDTRKPVFVGTTEPTDLGCFFQWEVGMNGIAHVSGAFRATKHAPGCPKTPTSDEGRHPWAATAKSVSVGVRLALRLALGSGPRDARESKYRRLEANKNFLFKKIEKGRNASGYKPPASSNGPALRH